MINDHESCYREMRRIDEAWREKFYRERETINQVRLTADDGGVVRVLCITNVYYTPEGLIVEVR